MQPVMDDVPLAKNDCNELRTCLEKYNIKSDDQVYDLSNNPTEKEVLKALSDIRKKLQAGK